MCLYVSKKRTKDFLATHPVGEKVKMYKAVYVNHEFKNGKLILEAITPYQGVNVKPGELKSGAKKKPLEKLGSEVHEGIHVCLTQRGTKRHTQDYIEVYILPEDLIAIGQHGDAVFTKITIEDYHLNDTLRRALK